MVEKKNFGLINEKGAEIGVYTGKQPRDAALKAANDSHTKIVLREKGTKKLHYFAGKRELTPVADSAPAWIREAAKKNNGKVFKATVEKIGVGHLQFDELARNDKKLFVLPAKKPAAAKKPAEKAKAKK